MDNNIFVGMTNCVCDPVLYNNIIDNAIFLDISHFYAKTMKLS